MNRLTNMVWLIVILSVSKLKSESIITAAEYYVGFDPGEGNGFYLSASDGSFDSQNESINFNINSSELGLGVHQIYIRFKDDSGEWGHPRMQTITVSSTSPGEVWVKEAEYYFGDDPGEGNGIPMNPLDGLFDNPAEILTGNETISESELLGQKTINIRAKSSNGVWGEPVSYSFNVYNEGPVLFVSNEGSDETGNGTQQFPFETIQNAIDYAGENDTVLVQPGTYTENIIWPETNGIKLISAGDSSNTIIDGGGVSSVIYMNPQSATIDTTTLIQGFKIMNGGNVSKGGGLLVSNSSPLLKEIHVSNNQSTTEGGGIHGYSSGLIITKSNVYNNSSPYGGGMWLEYSNVNFNEVKIMYNSCVGEGAGIRFSEGGSADISNSEISNNFGGSGVVTTSNTNNFNNVIFDGNTGAYYGGALNIYAGSNVNLDNCLIIRNSASHGGAIHNGSPSSLTINNTKIMYNHASYHGGAIGSTDNPTVNNAFIAYNTADGDGSQIWLYSAEGLYNNTTFISTRNPAIYSHSESTPTLVNCNFLNTNIYNNDNSSVITATNNYWNHSSGPYHPSQNPSGQGDSTNQWVNVDPWLNTPNTDAPPIPAQNTTVTGTGNDFISLNWDASPLGDLAGYKLYYDSDFSGYPYANSVDIGTDTSYTLSGLSLGVTYYLAVTSYDTDGNESWYSNEVSGATRVMQAQSLDIGGDEDLQHLITHTPTITFGYYDSASETQTSYQVQVSSQSDYSSADIWDTGEISSSDTSVAYAGAPLEDGATYYLRAKVGSGTFYSEWAVLTFRMNSTITMSSLNFDPGLGENGVYTDGFPTISSGPEDSEGDDVYVFYMLSDNEEFNPLADSALVYFDQEMQADVTWQPTIDPIDNQQYWVKAKGYDGYEYGNESNTYSFIINSENDTPSTFEAIYPIDSSEVSTTLPTLIWNIASDPDPLDTVRYMVQFGSTIPDLETFDTDTMTSYQFTYELEDNTDYYWRVIAEDMYGASTENDDGFQTFRVNTENDNPEGLVLLNPVNESLISEFPLVVVWTPATDLDGDSIWYDVHLTLSRDIVGTTMDNYFIIDSLYEDQEYYLMVTANDNNGGYIESEEHVFNVNLENTPPSPFELVTPVAEEVLTSTNVTFDWEHATDPDPFDIPIYLIHVETDTLSWDYELYTENSTETYITPEESFPDNSIYHWSVTADDMNGGIAENIGGPSMFVINVENDPPGMVSLVAPLDGSIQTDLTPNFYWTEADDPDPLDHVSYTMTWWNVSMPLDTNSFDTDSNGVTLGNFPDNSHLGWQVTANDIQGAESNSDPSYFYTDSIPEPPENFATIAPGHEVEGIATEVEFIWNQTYDPDPLEQVHYQLVYATDWEDSSTYAFSELIQDTSIILTLEDNAQYYWMVLALDTDDFMVGSNENTPNTMVVGTLSIDSADIPETFALHQNYPNPFNPTTQIKYDIPEDALVNISIYDVMGRSIRSLVNSRQTAGYRSIQWNATNDRGEPVSAGMYIYTIQAGEFRQTKKMVLLK